MKDLGAFIGTFLIKSIEKAKKVTLSMKCRGYNGKYYTTKKEKITKKEYMIATALFTSIAIPHLLNISILINNLITKIIK